MTFLQLCSRVAAPAAAVSCLGAVVFLSACDPEPESRASAYEVTTRDQLIGGPSATLDLGDFILENDQIRVGILGAVNLDGQQANSMGPGLYGGSLVDVDLVRPEAGYANGHGLDQFAEVFPTVNLKITGTEGVEIVRDGSDGGPAEVRMYGPSEPYFSLLELLDVLCVPATHGQFSTSYVLEPGKRYVKISTTVIMEKDDIPLLETNLTPDEVVPGVNVLPPLGESTNVIDIYQLGGLILGDFLLMGGNVDIFAPTIGFDEDGAVAENPNTLVQPFSLDFVAGVGDRVSYGFIAPPGGQLSVPLFTASQTAAFEAALTEEEFEGYKNYTVERYLVVGEGDVASIVDVMLELHDTPRGHVAGHVYDEYTGDAVSHIHVFVYRDPRPEGDTSELRPQDLTRDLLYSEFLTDRGMDRTLDGSFAGDLPVGRWVLMAKDELRAPSTPVPIEVVEGETVRVSLGARTPGNFSFSVTDQFGELIPCKLAFRPVDRGFHAEPILGETFLPRGYARVYFSPTGEEEITLRPACYQLVVSRGLEYSLYDSALDDRLENGCVEVMDAGKGPATHLDIVLTREVDTTGYIAADLHVHASNSFDSGVLLEYRVLSMAAEGIEFFASTDHDYITNYEPIIREMGLERFVTSVPGDEVTTIELGHMNGYPLDYDPSKRAGGAIDWTGMTPTEMIQALRSAGKYGPENTIAQINHPRDGILGYFDVYGYNPWIDVVDPQFDWEFAKRDITDLNLYLELLRIFPLFNHKNFTLDFDTIEVLNAKRMDLIRTPTWAEMNDMQNSAHYDEDTGEFVVDDAGWMYRIVERTMEEQAELDAGEEGGGYGLEISHRRGTIDDWFNLLNYGYRITAVGNSDTHGMTSVEAGCPRNYIRSHTDEPGFIDPLDIVASLKTQQAITTYGPFLELSVNGEPIGSTVSIERGESVTIDFTVQSASWIHLKRAELYENGVLIREFAIDPDLEDVVKLVKAVTLEPKRDSWYSLVAMGDQDMSPVYFAVELPYIELDAVIEDALIALDNEMCAGLFGASPVFPKYYPVYPFGMTNPIWVDVDGDADGDGNIWEPPGHAPWQRLDSREITPPSATGETTTASAHLAVFGLESR